MAIFTLAIYALLKDYKRNSLESMAKAVNTDYQKFQYFFSDSIWNLSDIKKTRLALIQTQRTTASTKNGFLVLDDTGCPKPFAKNTQGAQWQYCGPLKREEVCNVGVGAAFVSASKHFPLDVVPYLPADCSLEGKQKTEFKSKIQIAKELFENTRKAMDFSGVLFDSWYASTDFLEYIHNTDNFFYTEIKTNRNIFMHHPTKNTRAIVKANELVTLIHKHYAHKIKPVKYTTSDGSEVSYKTYSFEAKLKDCSVPVKLVVVLGSWNKDDTRRAHILITNKLNTSAREVVMNYLLRWGIEHCFKELKDTFYLDQYQLRHIDKIERYWNLCLIAWTLIYWIKQNGYLKKIIDTQPTTFSEFKQAINSLLEFSSATALSKNEMLAQSYFKIKSLRLKKTLTA